MHRNTRQHTNTHGRGRLVRRGVHPTRAERNRPRRKSTHTIPPARRLPRVWQPG